MIEQQPCHRRLVSVVECCNPAVCKVAGITDSKESECMLESEDGLLTGVLRSEVSNSVLV